MSFSLQRQQIADTWYLSGRWQEGEKEPAGLGLCVCVQCACVCVGGGRGEGRGGMLLSPECSGIVSFSAFNESHLFRIESPSLGLQSLLW
jgi:hypothetical protein